jgi:ribosomal-protein-alanine N-acetyltransferase
MDLEIFPGDELEKESFMRRVNHDGCFTMDLDGEVVGYLSVQRFGEDEGHIGRIGVTPSHQRKGLGTLLMKQAMEWFSEKAIKAVHLYTQDFNVPAQTLYKKFDFEVSGMTWHYFIPLTSLHPPGKYTCQEIQDHEINVIADMFPSMPAAQIQRFIDRETCLVLTLKNKHGDIVGAARFTPSFSGCMPFEITSLEQFDDFVAGLDQFSQPGFEHRRLTFTDNHELAEFCEKRKYKLHHRLYKMTCIL